jgi:hypothetical protein
MVLVALCLAIFDRPFKVLQALGAPRSLVLEPFRLSTVIAAASVGDDLCPTPDLEGFRFQPEGVSTGDEHPSAVLEEDRVARDPGVLGDDRFP